MADNAIRVERLYKEYRLGVLNKHAVRASFQRRCARLRGKSEAIGTPVCDSQCFFALRDVSFDVARGETLGIIGSNGSGKSTLLKILSGITVPTKGRAEIWGRSASLLEVGTGFHPEMTGRENVYMNGAILGMKKQEIHQKFDEIVAFSEIGQFIDTPVKRYSSGMYVRLAFAVAAHLEPEVLMVDEVLAVGDARFQRKSIGKMNSASSEDGRTVLFVSHNLSAIRGLCKKCIWLHKGELMAYGPTQEVLAAYMQDECTQGAFEVCWPNRHTAPQNSVVVVHRVFLGNAQGAVLQTLTCENTFFLHIDFEVITAREKTGFTFNLFCGETNILAFSSLSNTQGAWYEQANPPGHYRTACEIPGLLLNAGVYSIGINLFAENYKHYAEFRDLLRFTVSDSTKRRGDYYAPMEGVFRPALHWHTQPLPKEDT